MEVAWQKTFQGSVGKIPPCSEKQAKTYEPPKILLVFASI